MHVHNLHSHSSNDAVSDPNVTSLLLTLTEPTTVKANYRLEKSQRTLPATTAHKLHVIILGDSPTQRASVRICPGQPVLPFTGAEI